MYKIIKSKRKTIATKIDEKGNIIIMAPYFVKNSIVDRYFNDNKDKILKLQEKILSEISAKSNFNPKNSLKLLGMDLPIVYKNKVAFEDNSFILPCDDFSLTKDRIIALYKKLCLKIIFDRVEHYKSIIGVNYNSIRIKSVKSRWGSCSSKKNLNFNWKIVMADIKILDYVVVHELCHLKEMNHSKKFWNEVEKILPDYKIRIKLLRDFENQIRKENWD